MSTIQFTCPQCGGLAEKDIGNYNRAIKGGYKVYCSRVCSGIGRRSGKTVDQLKAEKAEYDKQYRYYQKDCIKEKKAAAFKKDYAANPEKYKEERKRRYPKHLKYLQSPEYKKWKREYDQHYVSKRLYGEFAECHILLKQIDKTNDYTKEQRFQDGLLSRTTKSKRKWKSLQQTTSKQHFGKL